MFLDIRGSRTFHRVNDDDKKYLGSLQWNAIENALSPAGVFGKARAILVCSPAPLVFLEPRITHSAAHAISRLEDFKGHWSFGEHIKEQIAMIDALSKWKGTGAGREVLVLGGKKTLPFAIPSSRCTCVGMKKISVIVSFDSGITVHCKIHLERL